jgi:hypothetical protein
MKKPKTTYTISANFQKSFIALIVGVFALQSAWLLWTWADQYAANPNVNGFEWWVTSSIGIPLAVFAIAWWLRPKQATTLGKIFDSTLVSVAATAVYGLVNQFTMHIYIHNITVGSGYDLSVAYEAVGALVFLLGYTFVLMYLRQAHKWR